MNSLEMLESSAATAAKTQLQVDRVVRAWVFLYAVAWVTEGALRKWIVPGWSDLIYFGRDILTIAAFALAVSNGVPHRKVGRFTIILVTMLLAGSLAALQIMSSAQPVSVFFLGLRDLLMPLLAVTLVFLSDGRVAALRKAETVLLVAAPFQAALVIVQVTSPSTSFWNNLNVDPASILFTSGDVVRATGTFTSPAGLTAFVTLTFAVVLARVLDGQVIKRRALILGLASCLVILLLGGSRGAILNCGIILMMAMMWTVIAAKRLTTVLRLSAALAASYFAAKLVVHLFPSVFDAFILRTEQASKSENSFSRIAESAFGYWNTSATPLGDGVGTHLLAGQAAGGNLGWIEGELVRWVTELGVVGLILVVARQALAISLLAITWRRSSLSREPSSWLLGIALFLTLLYGSVGSTPTQQGFTILAAALLMSSLGDPARTATPPATQRESRLR